MTPYDNPGREVAKGTGRLLAVVAGLALMIAGLGMGVSVVLLPVGIPAGLFGMLLFLWALFGRSAMAESPARPPGPP